MIIDAVVLAAGSSTRFGSDKRLHVLYGVPMLQQSLCTLLAVPQLRRVWVMLRDTDASQLPLLLGASAADARVSPVLLSQPRDGMGSNLARAVQQLPADVDAVLVALADMPFLQAETVERLCRCAVDDGIVLPVCPREDGAGERGHPVIFGRKFFGALTRLQGDVGARAILQAHAASVVEVTVSDAGVWRDVDVMPI